MCPRRWRRSTHVIGVAVSAVVAAAVVAAAFLTAGDHGTKHADRAGATCGHRRPGVVPVTATAPVPTEEGLATTLAAHLADPESGQVGAG